jgi:hypothetical protein
MGGAGHLLLRLSGAAINLGSRMRTSTARFVAGPDLGRTDQGWRGPPYRYRFWALKVLYG